MGVAQFLHTFWLGCGEQLQTNLPQILGLGLFKTLRWALNPCLKQRESAKSF